MKRSSLPSRRVVFGVRCDHAEQVKLVLERRPGLSQVFPLEPTGRGWWRTVLDLGPGEYHYCYHAYNGRTLTYLTPTNAVLDGLKAVLHVTAPFEPSVTEHDAVPSSPLATRPLTLAGRSA